MGASDQTLRSDHAMINVYDANDGKKLGTITEEQLQFLVKEMEEESTTDRDYYVNSMTVDMMEADDADAALIAFLRKALGGREDMDIRWEPA
jgi:processive 1,2-diacylglycerol beta-glucosyltransferase